MASTGSSKGTFLALMATARAEAAKEALATGLVEARRKATLAAAGLGSTYHLDIHRNDDIDDIIDYGAQPLMPVTSTSIYHDIILSDTKTALGVDKNGWAALQQDVKKFLARGGGAGKDDNVEVAKQFLESGGRVKMGDKYFGILPGAEAEGLLINEGGWCWGLEDDKLLPLVATIITAAKAVATPIASASKTMVKKRALVEEMVPSALAYKTQVSKKLRVTDESDQKIARPQTPATSVQDHPVCNRTLALKAIAATAPVRLQLQSMLFNNRTRFGSGKLLNFNKCDTLQALFTQIHNSYRFLFDDLHLSTRGICFFRLRLSLNSSSKETSHKSRKIDREGHAEWERAFEVMKTFVDGKGAKALDSLLLEVHFDALLVFETTPHTSED